MLFVVVALICVGAVGAVAAAVSQNSVSVAFYKDPITNIGKVLTTNSGPLGDGWTASATYSPAFVHKSNFAQLYIETNANYSDNDQLYAAGYLEGFTTAESIFQHYNNMLCQVDCSGYVAPELKLFFEEQDAWTREQVQKNPDCPYWGFIGKSMPNSLRVALIHFLSL